MVSVIERGREAVTLQARAGKPELNNLMMDA